MLRGQRVTFCFDKRELCMACNWIHTHLLHDRMHALWLLVCATTAVVLLLVPLSWCYLRDTLYCSTRCKHSTHLLQHVGRTRPHKVHTDDELHLHCLLQLVGLGTLFRCCNTESLRTAISQCIAQQRVHSSIHTHKICASREPAGSRKTAVQGCLQSQNFHDSPGTHRHSQ